MKAILLISMSLIVGGILGSFSEFNAENSAIFFIGAVAGAFGVTLARKNDK